MRRKIRIVHVAQAAGGVDRYLKCLLKYMDDRFENVLVCSQDYYVEEFVDIADKVEQIKMKRSIGKHDIGATLTVRKLIKKYNPDIVYAHSSKAGALVRMANIGMRSRCVYNPHGWAFNMRGSKKKQLMYTWLERIMAPFCSKVICISDAERQSALDKKICKESKLQVIFNGVDVDEYESSMTRRSSRDEIGIPADAFIVGVVGRLSQQKAPGVFIRMAKLVKEKIPNAYFIMVGDGEQKEEVMEYAVEHDINVHITGWVSNPLEYVELFDVACLLSRWEGFGLAIPEYMLVGKPIVATEVDAIPNLIQDGENGLLVEADNPRAACEAVIRLKNDADLRDRIVAQGSKDVREKYDAKRVSEEHEELFVTI